MARLGRLEHERTGAVEPFVAGRIGRLAHQRQGGVGKQRREDRQRLGKLAEEGPLADHVEPADLVLLAAHEIVDPVEHRERRRQAGRGGRGRPVRATA